MIKQKTCTSINLLVFLNMKLQINITASLVFFCMKENGRINVLYLFVVWSGMKEMALISACIYNLWCKNPGIEEILV